MEAATTMSYIQCYDHKSCFHKLHVHVRIRGAVDEPDGYQISIYLDVQSLGRLLEFVEGI